MTATKYRYIMGSLKCRKKLRKFVTAPDVKDGKEIGRVK